MLCWLARALDWVPVMASLSRPSRSRTFLTCLILPICACLATSGAAQAAGSSTTRVSVSSGGAQGNGFSFGPPSISQDGRYVAFSSSSSNLVAGDANGPPNTSDSDDVFVRDRQTSTTTCVSVSSLGARGNGPSHWATITPDGRYVAFLSAATNLVPNDTNGRYDAFVHDRLTGTTERVSMTSLGGESSGVETGQPSISDDGRYVAFASSATNLVAGDTNGAEDIFIRDRVAGTTTRMSPWQDGREGTGTYQARISGDGRYLVYGSSERLVGTDTNTASDVYIKDLTTGTVELISQRDAGTVGSGGSFAGVPNTDGRFVAFFSNASLSPTDTDGGGEDAYLRDRQTGKTELLSVTNLNEGDDYDFNDTLHFPSISGDGRFVAFETSQSLVRQSFAFDYKAYLRDRATGTTELLSMSSEAEVGDYNPFTEGVALSLDGRVAAFANESSNLVVGDTNSMTDVFVRDRGPNEGRKLTIRSTGATDATVVVLKQDRSGDPAATAPFAKVFDVGTTVRLTYRVGATYQWFSGTYKLYDHMELDGARTLGPIVMSSNRVLNAVFVNGFFLRIDSDETQVPIHLSSSDYFNRGDGTTHLNRVYKETSIVSATAPAVFGGKAFKHWEMDGVAQAAGQVTINVTMTKNVNLKAIYGP